MQVYFITQFISVLKVRYMIFIYLFICLLRAQITWNTVKNSGLSHDFKHKCLLWQRNTHFWGQYVCLFESASCQSSYKHAPTPLHSALHFSLKSVNSQHSQIILPQAKSILRSKKNEQETQNKHKQWFSKIESFITHKGNEAGWTISGVTPGHHLCKALKRLNGSFM